MCFKRRQECERIDMRDKESPSPSSELKGNPIILEDQELEKVLTRFAAGCRCMYEAQ